MSRKNLNRRTFIASATKVVGSAVFVSNTKITEANVRSRAWTVGQVMDLFISEVPGAPFAQTVDTLKSGNRDIKVTGIVTTMFATIDVIRKAIDLNANFIIAHEPTFYNHLDDTSWLENDPVYKYKAGLLATHNIAVWRNHDYVHRLKSDGVRAGVVEKLEWGPHAIGPRSSVFRMPPRIFRDLVAEVKQKLGIPTVRYIGDLSQRFERVLLMPGASGGRNQITTIGREKPDVVICGEISEWETAEYVRDARSKGENLALIVLGHVASEEPGSKFLADWLTKNVQGVRSIHVQAENSLMFL